MRKKFSSEKSTQKWLPNTIKKSLKQAENTPNYSYFYKIMQKGSPEELVHGAQFFSW
jgi:hypothetical protein